MVLCSKKAPTTYEKALLFWGFLHLLGDFRFLFTVNSKKGGFGGPAQLYRSTFAIFWRFFFPPQVCHPRTLVTEVVAGSHPLDSDRRFPEIRENPANFCPQKSRFFFSRPQVFPPNSDQGGVRVTPTGPALVGNQWLQRAGE